MTWRRGDRPNYALGRLKPGAMNKTEAAYAGHLELERRAGRVQWFKFEGVKLRLADNTFYTPDFLVLAADGVLECHEIKGWWADDARCKIKVAADLFPFRFRALQARAKRQGGGWAEEDFSNAPDASQRESELFPQQPAPVAPRHRPEAPF